MRLTFRGDTARRRSEARSLYSASPFVTKTPLKSTTRSYLADLLVSGLAATLLSGLPSTLYAIAVREDVSAATRAAGAMLLGPGASFAELFLAAALVHVVVSFFWAAILVSILPRRLTIMWAIVAAVLIGVLDLAVIAPVFFPEVAALPFLQQMADHLMWGATLGGALALRRRKSKIHNST
jgi:hypothetical protein